MGIFKSDEEKEEEKLEKLNKKLNQYNLTNLSADDKKEVSAIIVRLMGNSLIELGGGLGEKGEDIAKISCLKALTEQNWLIIKLLSEIKDKLDPR